MNEAQLKNLSTLLDMFSQRYPDRSPEAIKTTIEEALKSLSEVKPLTSSEQAEQDSCQLFNTGRFNDIVLAYVILAMRTAGTPQDEAMKLLDTIDKAFDNMTAEQALQHYRAGINGQNVINQQSWN